MDQLNVLCKEKAGLKDADICKISELSRQLETIAELTNADVFLDCPVSSNEAVVVAHAAPKMGGTYSQSPVGQAATADNEPAVFAALKTGMTVCDLKAVTQEGVSVRQNATPIYSDGGKVIAVLVREKDITDEILHEQKFEELAREYEKASDPALRREALSGESQVIIKEMHHRVKNNLQLVASILNLQARSLQDPATKQIFLENVERVKSMAAIHELLNYNDPHSGKIGALQLVDRLVSSYKLMINGPRDIEISAVGDDIELEMDTATSVAMVVTELVTNSIRHGFENCEKGSITIAISEGIRYHTITVGDNGRGFDAAKIPANSLGYSIIRATVEDKLGGKLRINSDSHGTKVSFDFQ